MASLPPRPASQRRSPPRESDETAPQPAHTNSDTFSSKSEDSQTLLLNRSQPTQTQKPAEQSSSQPQAQKSFPTPPQPDNDPRKCWICFNDETEDEPTSSEWRSPCPCVLVAHEKCLLDWIADMEAPSSRRRAGGGKGKILCPQCKSEIKVVRPRSVVVDMVRSIERMTGMLLLPGFFLVVGSAVYSTATLLGTQAVYDIFGVEDALHILEPLYVMPRLGADRSFAVRALHHLRFHWRLDLGLPLIPTLLVASRTTLADSFLPFVPLIFFASSAGAPEEMLQIQWPPSAAFTVAALPYIRSIYNTYYERVWLPREQRWLKEIQPRAGETDINNNVREEEEVRAQIEALQAEDDAILDEVEVQVDFDLFGDWNNGGAADNNLADENPPVPIARGPAPPLNAPPQDAQNAAPAPDVPQRGNRVRRERNLQFNTTNLADTILGALIFPSIAAAVGEALKQALPKSWVSIPAGEGRPTGFLQTRWGRSILGGCLFVGMKDAVMLYVRWRMAQNHRKRRIVDFQGKGKAKGR